MTICGSCWRRQLCALRNKCRPPPFLQSITAMLHELRYRLPAPCQPLASAARPRTPFLSLRHVRFPHDRSGRGRQPENFRSLQDGPQNGRSAAKETGTALGTRQNLAGAAAHPGTGRLNGSSSLASTISQSSRTVRFDRCRNPAARTAAASRINTPAEMLISSNPMLPSSRQNLLASRFWNFQAADCDSQRAGRAGTGTDAVCADTFPGCRADRITGCNFLCVFSAVCADT